VGRGSYLKAIDVTRVIIVACRELEAHDTGHMTTIWDKLERQLLLVSCRSSDWHWRFDSGGRRSAGRGADKTTAPRDAGEHHAFCSSHSRQPMHKRGLDNPGKDKAPL
jgi:hypothetical protein